MLSPIINNSNNRPIDMCQVTFPSRFSSFILHPSPANNALIMQTAMPPASTTPHTPRTKTVASQNSFNLLISVSDWVLVALRNLLSLLPVKKPLEDTKNSHFYRAALLCWSCISLQSSLFKVCAPLMEHGLKGKVICILNRHHNITSSEWSDHNIFL